jgi:hypothetical protein
MFRLMIKKYLTANKIKFIKVTGYGIVTNTAFGVFLRSTADACQQNIENKDTQLAVYSYERTRHIATIGAVIGPFMYAWYTYLDRILPGKTFGIISKKIILDQIVGGTVFIFIYIVGICLLEGQTFKQAITEFVQKFPFVYMVNSFWKINKKRKFYKFFLFFKKKRWIGLFGRQHKL